MQFHGIFDGAIDVVVTAPDRMTFVDGDEEFASLTRDQAAQVSSALNTLARVGLAELALPLAETARLSATIDLWAIEGELPCEPCQGSGLASCAGFEDPCAQCQGSGYRGQS